jgi:DNA-binding transcriptional regulator YdaS (Cro superfamily)
MELKAFIKTLPVSDRDGFAARCGTTIGHIQNVMYGLKSCATDLAVSIERESGNAVTRKELRADWTNHWPELIGTPGAPEVPAAEGAAQ